MTPLRVWCVPHMRYTPFQHPRGLDIMLRHGVEITRDAERADICVSSKKGWLAPSVFRFRNTKKWLIWTHEPRFHIGWQQWETIEGVPVRIMNLYRGETMLDNHYCVATHSKETPACGSPTGNFHTGENRMAFIGGKAACGRVAINGKDLDLTAARQRIALAGHTRGFVDIRGKYWPEGVSLEISRDGPWHARKLEILTGRYRFNLCSENTAIAHYCTEKIWDAIRCGCLPVYHATPTIRDDFPADSFVDAGSFPSPEALFDKLVAMDEAEFLERYRKCRNVWETAFPQAEDSLTKSTMRILEVLQEIRGSNA